MIVSGGTAWLWNSRRTDVPGKICDDESGVDNRGRYRRLRDPQKVPCALHAGNRNQGNG